MTAVTLLDELRRRRVELIPEGVGLRYRAPKGALTPDLRQALAAHKVELLSLLTGLDTGSRLNPADCFELLCAFHAENEAAYEPGALTWAFAHCPELKRRFDETETAIDRLAGQHPTEADFRRALEAHANVWREIVARHRAHRERQAEKADPMPELPEGTVLAICVSYGDGEPGTWDAVRRAR
ncbi:MAG: hypothetical protein ABSA52_05065 [Candidatus Binatia bacterium]|jgi:hypothetical protein